MRKSDEKRTFCPVSEIDWGMIFHGDRRPVLGNNDPDPEGELLPMGLMIRRHQAPYPPDSPQAEWIARQIKDWWQTRENEE